MNLLGLREWFPDCTKLGTYDDDRGDIVLRAWTPSHDGTTMLFVQRRVVDDALLSSPHGDVLHKAWHDLLLAHWWQLAHERGGFC